VGHELFFLHVYRLLCCVLASEQIASLEDGSSQRSLSTFVLAQEQAEISRLLISVASFFRVKSDDGSWMHGFWLHKSFIGVGEVVEDLDNPTAISQLDLREACNKIMHAGTIHFDVETNDRSKAKYLTSFVYLYGKRGKVNWKATLDVVEFCRAAANVIV
ncbi:MAG: hypothetical protein AAB393_07125, partial [Bacteroidota bacterium]